MRKYLKDMDTDILKSNIKRAVMEINEDVSEVIVEEYIDNHYGNDIPSIFYDMIDYEPETKRDEEGWYSEFLVVLSKVDDELQEILEEVGILDEYKDYYFYIGYTENGDFGLLMGKKEEL